MRNKYLLKKEDFQLVDSISQKYLFLADSLRFFKITNPDIEEYLKVCMEEDISAAYPSKKDISQIGKYLLKDEIPLKPDVPNLNYDSLNLNVTNGCNLACKYCFENSHGKNAKSMTFEIAQKAIDNMLAQKKEMEEYSIFYFGGEPLFKKELLRTVSDYAYKEIVEKRKKKVKFLMNTNATLIDDYVLSLFKDYSFIVTVSIDGPREIHDANRIFSNGNGSYNKVEEKIELLKKNGIKTQLRPTFSPKLKNLSEAFDFFEKHELPYGYAFSHTNNYQSNRQNTYFDKQQLEDTNSEFRKVMDYFAEKIINKEKIFCSELIRKINIIRYRSKRTYLCEAGRKNLAVSETGNYFSCQTMVSHSHAAIGDVYSDINDTKRYQYMAKDITKITMCNNCSIRGLCVGGCEVERMNFGNDSLLHEQMCDLFRLEWNNVLYLYSRIGDFL
jgi:uncharacterized protein